MSISKSNNLAASICSIEYISKDEIGGFSIMRDNYQCTITLTSGANWSSIYFTQSTAKFTQKTTHKDAGLLYDQLLSFNFPGDDASDILSFDNLTRGRYLVRVTYDDGTKLVFGTPRNPAKFNFDANQEHKECNFSCRHYKPAWNEA